MYCPSCGNEISVELKYCNRCGANLSGVPEVYAQPMVKPMKLGVPAIVLGLTITIGLGIIFSSATELAERQVHPAAIAWMVIFGLAALFGCTALMLRFWLKVLAIESRSLSATESDPTVSANAIANSWSTPAVSTAS
ncbi:MAG TPA: zinc ribbon domain-containing protein [Pyrinomonadaceae bacterium]|nr:zinc ribbon domain-containing protein [Pyrinomonadaceae bacterium]